MREMQNMLQELMNVVEIYDAGYYRGRIVTVDSEEIRVMLFDEKEVPSLNVFCCLVVCTSLSKIHR